jgi:hypothetical protein
MSRTLTNDDFPRDLVDQDFGNLSVVKQAPRSDWSDMGDAEHFVQFYETDLFLMNSLGGFISAGLRSGDGCVVVATKAHRDALETRLKKCGLDVSAAVASGQYISLE